MDQKHKNMDNTHSSINIPVIYHPAWQDYYGTGGWKLNFSINHSVTISSTSIADDVISTSVIIHDVLDHNIPEFEISAHRAEVIALTQLHLRAC